MCAELRTGRSDLVAALIPKLIVRVRFSSPASLRKPRQSCSSWLLASMGTLRNDALIVG